jgi:hypothetical protein
VRASGTVAWGALLGTASFEDYRPIEQTDSWGMGKRPLEGFQVWEMQRIVQNEMASFDDHQNHYKTDSVRGHADYREDSWGADEVTVSHLVANGKVTGVDAQLEEQCVMD